MCFNHIQDLSCAFWKIFSTSTTPCLNWTAFLYFQILHTIAAQRPFQTRFCLLLICSRWKFTKWCFGSLCWKLRMSVYLKKKDHTLWANLHSRNRCWLVSSSTWHKPHKDEITCTPLLLRHVLVGILSSRTLQVVVKSLGRALVFHRQLKTSLCCPLV